MFKLSESEMQKIKALAYDETAIEALRKFFLNHFLDDDPRRMDAPVLASSRLAIDRMESVFSEIERMIEKPAEETLRKNIV